MPSEDISKLVFQVLANLENGSLLGYVFAICTIGGWYLHAKRQRRLYKAEMARLAKQRDTLQDRALSGLLVSSAGKTSKDQGEEV